MAMNNNFDELAEQFLDRHPGAEFEDEDELEDEIRGFLRGKGLDSAWHDEAIEVIKEHYEANS